MFYHYLKAAFRNLSNSKSYSLINILGLAVGLSGFIALLLYLNFELSYDRWNPELKKVYRLSLLNGEDYRLQTPAPLGRLLAARYSNCEAATTLQPAGDFESLVATGDKKIYQKGLVVADSTFLKVFPYKLLQGNAATALNTPNAALISLELARKLFGQGDPMGKTLKLYGVYETVITGVFQEPAGPSQLNAQLVFRSSYEQQSLFWENYSYETYIKVRQPLSQAALDDQVNRIFFSERLKKEAPSFEAYQQLPAHSSLVSDAVPDIHNFPRYGNSHFTAVTLLLALSVLLLLAGAINFSNLAIARALSRAKEVGLRKVLGSGRRQLIYQFMHETAFQCLLSLAVALLLVGLGLPLLNRSFGLQLSLGAGGAGTVNIFLQIGLCLVLLILLSGLYPSIFLSGFNAARVLKGSFNSGHKGRFFRNSLIVLQFMIAAFFITATLVISRQMQYMQHKDKGFSPSQVMRITATQASREKRFEEVRQRLLSLAGVESVAKTTYVPGDRDILDTTTVAFRMEGREFRMVSVKISTDYFKTLQVPVTRGRDFGLESSDQHTRTAILNETAARKLGGPEVLGKTLRFPYCDSIPIRIVGIVRDFHAQGFESAIQPILYTIGNEACMFQSGGAMLVKLKSDRLQAGIAAISQVWKEIEPDYPIRYSFLDENFQQYFQSYLRLQQLILFFSVVAILISVMGLFALSAYFTRQRTKEIGIRKVLGASVAQLATLLSRDFFLLVLLAVLLTMPLAWIAMQRWLETFAYRIGISWWMLLVPALLALLIALLTVSFQTLQSALANPVKSLRSQ